MSQPTIFLGNDVPLYVFYTSLITIALIAITLLDLPKSSNHWADVYERGYYRDPATGEKSADVPVTDPVAGVKVSGRAGSAAAFFRMLSFVVGFACIALPMVVVIYYFEETATNHNMKNIMILSTVCCFAAFCLYDWVLFTFRPLQLKSFEYGNPSYGRGYSVLAHLSMGVYLGMLIACMYTFSSVAAPTTEMRTITTFCIGMVMVLQIVIIVRVYNNDLNNANVQLSTITTGSAMKVTVPDVPLETLSAVASSRSQLRFGPSGNLTFDPSHPDNYVLHKINNEVKTKGAANGLSIQDYAVLNDAGTNDYYVMDKESTATVLQYDPVAPDVNNIKYGFMGIVKESKPDAIEVSLMNRMYRKVPAYVSVTENVLGFGYGHGTWLAIPWWFG